jgi:hypothetical protein
VPGHEERKRERAHDWRKWAFAVVPALGLIELTAHAVQTQSVAREADWKSARDYVAVQAKPEDLVAFAPRWADPLGSEYFGPQIATIERVARADETRFARAFEVSIRGAHLPAFAGWRRVGEQRFGAVSVTRWENPTPVTVIDDLVSMVGPHTVHVSRIDPPHGSDCPFVRSSMLSGGLGFGPTIPADRFVCPAGGLVVATVVSDLEYVPRRCVYAPPPGGPGAIRLRFPGVRMGHALHGHHGLYAEAERHRTGAPVTLTFRVGDAVLGSVVHHDGEGWKPFEFDTSDLAGQRLDVTVETSSPSGEGRMYCFEADTR